MGTQQRYDQPLYFFFRLVSWFSGGEGLGEGAAPSSGGQSYKGTDCPLVSGNGQATARYGYAPAAAKAPMP